MCVHTCILTGQPFFFHISIVHVPVKESDFNCVYISNIYMYNECSVPYGGEPENPHPYAQVSPLKLLLTSAIYTCITFSPQVHRVPYLAISKRMSLYETLACINVHVATLNFTSDNIHVFHILNALTIAAGGRLMRFK